MPQQKGTKGNPASHRMSNKALKERRARSWAQGEKRKEQRRLAQKEREYANHRRRAVGEPTPWEAAKAARAARRAAARKGKAA